MRLMILFLLLGTLNANASGDTTRKLLYSPEASVATDVAKMVAMAKKEKKHVMLQIGGNWCSWCYKFNAFVETDSTLKAIVHQNFLVYHLNYSKENKNLPYLEKLGFPQRFGFPVMVILDANGKQLHTQDSGLLEKGNGYDFSKVKTFFLNWAPSAFDKNHYKE